MKMLRGEEFQKSREGKVSMRSKQRVESSEWRDRERFGERNRLLSSKSRVDAEVEDEKEQLEVRVRA